jgi:hypothetical protein
MGAKTMLQAKIIYLIEDQELNGRFIDYKVRKCPLDKAEPVLQQLKDDGFMIISATIEEVEEPHRPALRDINDLEPQKIETPLLDNILSM